MSNGRLPSIMFGNRQANLRTDLNEYRDELIRAVPSLKSFDALGKSVFGFKAQMVQVNGTTVVASSNTPMGGLVGESSNLTFQIQLTGISHFFHEGRKYRVTPGSFIFLPGVERYGESEQRSLVTISLKRSKLLQAWQALTGRYEDEADPTLLEQVVSADLNQTRGFPLIDHLFAICRQIELSIDDQHALNFLGIDEHLHRLVVLALSKSVGVRERSTISGSANSLLLKIEDNIRENLHRPMLLIEIATMAGISVRTLNELFQEKHRLSPGKWIQEVRLEQARAALLDKSDSGTVTEICYRFGFPKPSDFAAYYQRKFGERPSETLRRKQRKH